MLLLSSILLNVLSDQASVPRTYMELKLDDGVSSSVAVYVAGGKPTRAALLLHGFSGSKENLALVASSLAGAGYVVFTPDWRGHGETGGRCPVQLKL